MADVMLVDDSKFMRKMLSDILIQDGHQIVGEAENPKEAIEFYKMLRPDLVTLDIIMPEVEGINALSALKAMIKVNSKVKMLMVSAMGQEKVVQEYIQAGAKDFIVKPFQPPDVETVVTDILKE